MDISSDLTGLLTTNDIVKIPDWMSKLAEQEKEAIRDDLDQIANPEELSENDLFNGENNKYINEDSIFESPEMKMQYWTPNIPSMNEDHVEQEYDYNICQNNCHTNKINEEIENMIQDIVHTSERPGLSVIKTLLENKFSSRIAYRYIKSNYGKLSVNFKDDIQFETPDTRNEDVSLNDAKLENKPKQAKLSTDDIVKEANEIFTKHSNESLKNHLIKKFGEENFKKAFSNYKIYHTKQSCVIIDKIDNDFKILAAKKMAKAEILTSLKMKYGSFVDEYLKSNNIDKISSFINKGTNVIGRTVSSHIEHNAQLQSKEVFVDNKKLAQIDNEFKVLAAKKINKAEIINSLKLKHGSFVDDYLKETNVDKIYSFINKGSKVVDRAEETDHKANLKSKDIVDTKQYHAILENIDSDFKKLASKQVDKAEIISLLKTKHGSFMQDYLKNVDKIPQTETKGIVDMKQAGVILDKIDSEFKTLAAKKMSKTEILNSLKTKYGSFVDDYSKSSNIDKIYSFINKGSKVIDRADEQTVHQANLQSKEIVVDTKKIVREAYLKLMSRESLNSTKQQLMTKYGSVAEETLNKESNLSEVEHKLGYFYADSNYFNNCDKMVDFFNKKLKYAFLLKANDKCKKCAMNLGNICKKTSLVLSENPLKISKEDGGRIIQALVDIRMVKADFASGFVNQLNNDDNTSLVKSFLEQAKKNITVKTATSKVLKTQNNEMRSFYSGMNDVNVNQLNSKIEDFNVVF